jgi:ElaB/YqjD/DUF883 family membrane-anchored ribosome-binding protein
LATRTNARQQSRDDSIKELKRDFERRIHDIQVEAGEEMSGAVDESVDFLKREVEQGLTDLRKQIDKSAKPGRDAIRESPFSSMGAALGAGVIAGVLLGVFLGRPKSED